MRRLMSQDPLLVQIPFIFLTARTDPTDRISGIRDGADDYITKPYVPEELLARIEAVLRRVKREQARGREQMQEAARQSIEQLKRQIMLNFQHEMRTPLANIVMPLEMAVTNKFETPEEQIEFIRTALSNADRMDALVNDFILLTKIDQNDLNPIRQSMDVNNHILLPVRKRFDRYKFKQLEFTQSVATQGTIAAPRAEFVHALVHLVDNAFKFTPEHGKVHLAVEAGANGGALVTVHDTGPGIPAELREKVFERNYQISDGDNRSHEGLGVGLFIARSIFESLGGTVSILDTPRGCSVQAQLPDRRPDDVFYGG